MTFSILESFIIYLFLFVFSAGSLRISASSVGVIRYLFLLVSVGLPALLASIRSVNIGTDYIWYVDHFIEMATKIEGIHEIQNTRSPFEFGYSLLIFLITRFETNVPLVSFYVYFLLAVLVLHGLSKLVTSNFLYLAYFFYLASYWLFGFNILRQCIAMALTLIAVGWLFESKPVRFLAVTVIASLFQRVSIVMTSIFVLRHFAARRGSSAKGSVFAYILIVAGIVLLLEYHPSLLEIKQAFITTSHEESWGFIFFKNLLRILLVFPIVFIASAVKIPSMRLKLNLHLVYFSLLIHFATGFGSGFSRVALLYEWAVIPLSISVYEIVLNRYGRNGGRLFIVYLILYFVGYKFYYINAGGGDVFPYSIG